MYKLAIFDLDGTLVNSLEDLADAWNKALATHGFETYETERYRYFVGNGSLKLIERVLPHDKYTEENISKLMASFNEEYGNNYNVKTRPYSGMAGLVERLGSSGVLTAVASNKPDMFTHIIIDEMFGDIFSYVSGKKDGFATKPNADIVMDIMDKLGAAPSETVIIGDSSVDMLTAKNAGTDSIGCTWGFRTEDELIKSGACHIAHTAEDVYLIICGK